MGLINFFKTGTGNELSAAKGSDGRVNVSSRSDGRGYYNSRDESESYVMVFDDANAASSTTDFVAYLKNDKTNGKHLVIRSASVNCEVLSKISFHIVTGTATGGAAITPTNLNQAGVARSATVTARGPTDSSSSPLAGLTADKEVDHVNCVAGGHEEFRFLDQLRIGQDQAIGVRMDAGTDDSQVFGVIFFYFE